MPGEIVTLLLGVQGGDEEALACLYAATNPVVSRYLRVVADGDPYELSLTTWSTLLERMPRFVADEDDDWLKLAVATARETAAAAGTLRSGDSPSADAAAPAEDARTPSPEPATAAVDEGVAALRACTPEVAEVLAIGVVAALGRDSIATITGRQPGEVLALVHEGKARLTVPLANLIVMMRVPGSSSELSDLSLVLPLLATQSRPPLPSAASQAAAAAVVTEAAAATAAESSAIDLLTWASPEGSTTTVAQHRGLQAGASPWARRGAGAAAWVIAAGGLGAAAAMSGLVPGILHSLFGDEGNGPTVVAHGPAIPGTPSTPGGGQVANPRPSVPRPGGQVPGEPSTGGLEPSTGGAGVVVTASMIDSSIPTQLIVVPAVLNGTPSQPGDQPTGSGSTPPPSAQQPPTTGTGTVTGADRITGKDHPKHSTGLAKGKNKAAQSFTRTFAVAATPHGKAHIHHHGVAAAHSRTAAGHPTSEAARARAAAAKLRAAVKAAAVKAAARSAAAKATVAKSRA